MGRCRGPPPTSAGPYSTSTALGHSSWATTPYNHDDYGELTEQQKRIMAPASMDAHPEVVQE